MDYAVKVTVAPSSVSEDDIETLHCHGFDDRDILDIVYVICLYSFNDRMADAMESPATIFSLANRRARWRYLPSLLTIGGKWLLSFSHGVAPQRSAPAR